MDSDLKRIALGIEYSGTSFEGWQTQPHGRTVQDVLETALSRVASESIELICAGRTDAGVHASAQVAHFDTSADRPLTAWVRGVNAHLPDKVAVNWAVGVDDQFHARFSAKSRRYRYLLINRSVRPAILSGQVGWCHAPLDEGSMQEAAGILLGVHDFSAFRAASCQAKSPIRELKMAEVRRTGEWISFDFEANAFLYHMVRNMVGALIHVGRGHVEPEWLKNLLQQRDRKLSPPTFSPDGLYLAGVEYPDLWALPARGRILSIPAIPL
jgi:tRNA pseudouridine38-40 synthase